MKVKFGKILWVSVICWAILPAISLAQINIDVSSALPNELGVEISPTYPGPNEVVSVRLSLFTDNLDSADITWYINDKVVLKGKGETRHSFRVGLSGEETRVNIKIKLLSGPLFSKSFVLNPAGVDLVWEADSYVPPFYKGKALHPRQGDLKIVAIPDFVKNGKKIAAGNLIYQWSNNIDVYQNRSGYGKNVLALSGSILGRGENIKVLVTDPVNNLTAQGFIDILPVDPEIVFYEIDPYYGHLFDLAVNGTSELKGEEIQILAAPYYFTKDGDNSFKYEWRLNNQLVQNLSDSRTVVFRKPENESGKSSVSLAIENIDRILQQAEKDLGIVFEN